MSIAFYPLTYHIRYLRLPITCIRPLTISLPVDCTMLDACTPDLFFSICSFTCVYILFLRLMRVCACGRMFSLIDYRLKMPSHLKHARMT